MGKITKLSVYIMLFALFIQVLPAYAGAESNENHPTEVLEKVFVFADEPEGTTELYEEANQNKVLANIPDGTEISLIEKQDDYSHITYKDESNVLTGYVPTNNLIEESKVETFLAERNSQLEDQQPTNDTIEVETGETVDQTVSEEPQAENDQDSEIDNEAADDKSQLEIDEPAMGNNEKAENEKAEPIQNENQEEKQLETETAVEEKSEQGPAKEEKEKLEGPIQAKARSAVIVSAKIPQITGVALKSKTNVYVQTSTKSSVVKSYKQGQILKFQALSSNWYQATVYVNGKKQTGYLYAKDVDVIGKQQRQEGFALKQPVRVYASPTRNSTALKTYKKGSKLIYRTFSSQWYQATVYLNGKATTGYIHAADVGEFAPSSLEKQKGIALNTVRVYSKTSTGSSILKSYGAGHILQYYHYNSAWHMATVYVKGTAHTGYIRVSDVETAKSPQNVRGIAAKGSTRVYSKSSTGSKTLKTYKQGHLLKYKTFTTNWYQATVYIKGKAHTGYIHKNDVENATTNPKTQKGVATKNPTMVYASPSTGSKVLKSYKYASGLKFRTFTDNWFEATVIINGHRKTGYLHKSQVLISNGKLIVLDAGHGGHDPGAVANGVREKDINLSISLSTRRALEGAGFSVLMTRSTDVFLTLQERTRIANTSGADLFISIHANSAAPAAKGLETYWYGKYEKANSRRLATSLQNNLVQATGSQNRGVKEGNFHVIRETKIPSALIETGFVTNKQEANKLKQKSTWEKMATGIAKGIIDFFR